jgi:hypothetical protein
MTLHERHQSMKIKTPKTKPANPMPKAKEYPKPYGTKAQNNKGAKMQAAYQKRNNQKGR